MSEKQKFTSLLFLILLVIALAASTASAQTTPPPPAGATILNLSATEHGEIAQDILIANLSIEKTGADARSIQTQINTVMTQAVAQAKTVSGVEVSTGQYYVYPVDGDPNAKIKTPRSWRGAQTLQLKSTQSEALLSLAGAMQDIGLNMQGLSYSVSPQKEEDARDALMEAALTKLRAKATRAAKALGKTKIDFAEINVDAGGGVVMRPMAMMAMAKTSAAPMAAPVAEAGTSDIDLTVTAKVLLQP